MSSIAKTAKRPYNAPRRAAAATRTREAVVSSAKAQFERLGWAGTTMRSVATEAGVSQKTVEAIFQTKAALLQAAVDFSIRGDIRPIPMPQRKRVKEMEAARDVTTMLDLHAAHVRTIEERSALIAGAVEHAATSDLAVAQLWERMTNNRRTGVRWAATTLLTKPDVANLDFAEVVEAFWVALDWGTYRTLTGNLGMTPDAFEAWLRQYYRGMFL